MIDNKVDFIAWDVHPSDANRLVYSRLYRDMISDSGLSSVVLVHSKKIHEIVSISKMICPDYLLTSSNRDNVDIPRLKNDLGGVKLMFSLGVPVKGMTVEGYDPFVILQEYEKFSDIIILDTITQNSSSGFGCSGRTSDWGVASGLVKKTEKKVILAGGLSEGNVRQAVCEVNPFGVDACTSLEELDKSKSVDLCKNFIRAARGS